MTELNPLITGDPPYEVGKSSTFSVRLSDHDGDGAVYIWVLKGPDGSRVATNGGKEVSFTFEQPGNHQVKVAVNTEEGLTGSRSVTITAVEPEELDPSITISPSFPPAHEVGETLTFGVTPEYNGRARCNWTIHGPKENVVDVGSGKEHTYTPQEEGDYDIHLSVETTNGETGTASEIIMVFDEV